MRLGLATILLAFIGVALTAKADEFVTNGTFSPANNAPPTNPAGYGPVAGWTEVGAGTGSTVFITADLWNNGTIPSGATVGFIQGAGSFSQMLTGLTVGQTYTLTFVDNARDNTDNSPDATPTLVASVGGATLFSSAISPVGGSNPFHSVTETFVAGAGTEDLEFASSTVNGADGTLLLSDVSVSTDTAVPPVPEPSSLMLLGTGVLGAAGMMRRRFARS